MSLKNWPLASVVASTVTDLVVPPSGKEVAIVGLIICNTDTSNIATVTITLTDSANTVLATLFNTTISTKDSVAIDTKIFIAISGSPNKIRVMSTISGVSFLASGDES